MIIENIHVLESKSNHKEAFKILRRCVSLAEPIIKKRNWQVGRLSEFYPVQTNLLGLNKNAGQEILVRLRSHYDEGKFLDFEQIMGTVR